MNIKDLLVGILFTVLYASGAVVMKFGIHSAPPLTLSTIRFIIAGLLLLLYLYGFQKGKYRMPNRKEFKVFILVRFIKHLHISRIRVKWLLERYHQEYLIFSYL